MPRTRRVRKHGKHTRKNIIQKGYKTIEQTSKKVMPNVKSGLENVGSKVTKGVSQSVPFLQRISNNIFGYFFNK